MTRQLNSRVHFEEKSSREDDAGNLRYECGDLGRLTPSRLAASESFTRGQEPLHFSVGDFWQWGFSNLASNALRGCLAEYLVRRALNAQLQVRGEWDAFDLITSDGVTLEVKSSAYLQTWRQRRLTKPLFKVRQTRAWDEEAGVYQPHEERRRQADVYVFALLHHQHKPTLNPLDVAQWTFFVLRSDVLNEKIRPQGSIGLTGLRRLRPHAGTYDELPALLRAAVTGASAGANGDAD